MSNKQKEKLGKFFTSRNSFLKIKKNLTLSILGLVLIAGTGGLLFKYLHPQTKKIADTKLVDTSTPAWWQKQYFGSSVCEKDNCAATADPDSDKLTNAQEYYYHTNPLSAYTVGDTLSDGELVAAGFDPSKPGHVTFDQVSTPENLLGESLVFSDDIKKIVADSNDISQVNLPLAQDDELQIIYTEDSDTYKTYASKLHSTINRYFSDQDSANIGEILKSGTDAQVYDIKTKSESLASDLKQISVPAKFLMFHKYNIAMFQLLSEIIPAPLNLNDSVSDEWYDKVQEFLAVQQKLDFEKQFLSKEFPE
ncbi:MAG TPA: hypothetical protein VL306_01385 [Methylomirabilota bacterium]|nr:hypothetical protein [Methylomirabilota bacterium]